MPACCMFPVVWQCLHNRIPGAENGTGSKSILLSSVKTGHAARACIARTKKNRGDQYFGKFTFLLTWHYAQICKIGSCYCMYGSMCDQSCAWGIFLKCCIKLHGPCFRCADFNMYTVCFIVYPTIQSKLLCQLYHKRPVANPLYNAANKNMICVLCNDMIWYKANEQ